MISFIFEIKFCQGNCSLKSCGNSQFLYYDSIQIVSMNIILFALTMIIKMFAMILKFVQFMSFYSTLNVLLGLFHCFFTVSSFCSFSPFFLVKFSSPSLYRLYKHSATCFYNLFTSTFFSYLKHLSKNTSPLFPLPIENDKHEKTGKAFDFHFIENESNVRQRKRKDLLFSP